MKNVILVVYTAYRFPVAASFWDLELSKDEQLYPSISN